MMVLLLENHKCVKRPRVTDEGPTQARADVNHEHCQIVIQWSGTTNTEKKFRLGSLNVGTMRGCEGKVAEALPRRK